jgi:aspartyl-tRNA(Asn)/glutamyl-tRNA(Gln) amidotransferase subunit A
MHTISASELHRLFIRGDVSAAEIVRHHFRRIDALEPDVGAFLLLLRDEAFAQAELLDARRRKGEKLGKLAGIPIAVKDLIHIKGHPTTCASKILKNFVAPFDATAIRRIKEEDGIIIGKTNLDEFAMGSSCENSALKVTRNPWDLSRVPGGSSGGSAAAVAAGMAQISLGTDTGGSIRLPASFCGICGMKPTYGRVSRFGVVAFGSSLDQIGPLAYSCEDIELAMEVMGVHCDRDSTSLPGAGFTPVSFQERFASRFTIGVPWQFLENLPKESREVFNRSLNHLKSLGASVIDVDLSILKYAISVYYIVATAELSTNLARFDGVRYGHRSPNAETLDELYDRSREEGFGDEPKRRIVLGTFVLSSGYQDAYYKQAQKVRRLIIDKFAEAFRACDFVAMPVASGGAFPFGAKQDPLAMYLEDIYTVGANMAGLPAISLPAGRLSDGCPIGIQLVAPQRHDADLTAIGKELQKITEYHKERPTLGGKIA